MGQKSKKKSGAGSASKLKKLDELAPIVALPATKDGEAITSASAIATGEAMTGEIGVAVTDTGSGKLNTQGTIAISSGKSNELENSKSVLVLDAAVTEALKGGVTTTAIIADPSSSVEAPVTVKPTSTNRKVLMESQNLKTAAKSVSFAGNVQISDGTGLPTAFSNSVTTGQSGMGSGKAKNSVMTNVEAEKAGNSSMKVQPAEKLISSTDKAQNLTGVGLSIANSNVENAANSNSGAVNAGNLSTNAQNLCINSKVFKEK